MKSFLASIGASTLLAAFALGQQPRYTVVDLGTLPGGNFSQAFGVNNNGLVTGLSNGADGNQHAVLWQGGKIEDISSPGLGGPSSGAGGVNASGVVIGQAESSAKDTNNANLCGYGTGLQCLPFLWQNGLMTALPTLGGVNASFGSINNLGQAAGYAETGVRDPDCPAGPAINGTGPQALDFEAVIWGPAPGQIRELPPLAGDTVGLALGINDNGQAVGVSGSCANTIIPGFTAGPHAVFWGSDGSAHDLGNLGGTVNPAILAVGNAAMGINNQGQVVGTSALAGNIVHHPFLWTGQTGMQDLGVLPGDFVGAGLAINNLGQIVGASIAAPGPLEGSPRAFFWQNGVMTDLNALVPANSPLYLLTACGINDVGQIAGFGVTSDGDLHAFLATPVVMIQFSGPNGTMSTTNTFQTYSRSVTLFATRSTSSNPGPLSYSWTVSPRSASAAIISSNTAAPVFQLPAYGTYQFTVTVTDATGATATATVTVQYL